MDVAASRHGDRIGPYCVARDCDTPVIECNGVVGFFDVEPHPEGKYKLTETSSDRPYARLLTTAQQFGQQGHLHRKHDSYCLKAKRLKKR